MLNSDLFQTGSASSNDLFRNNFNRENVSPELEATGTATAAEAPTASLDIRSLDTLVLEFNALERSQRCSH
ncbi:hypothetical protein M0802_002250 [Mischocyttarus mexicanus]|nr:hypothetical protein M0802_002250 [Mischocyttarus mexicanus]